MGKIKNLFVKVSEKIKETIQKYPITMIIVLILTVISAICLDDFLLEEKTLADILFVGTIWAVGTLFSETVFKEKRIAKYISIILTFLIAIFFHVFINKYKMLFGFSREKTKVIISNIFTAYLISLSLLIIYKLSKDSKLDVKEYLLNVFSESFIVGITYIILNIGIAAVAGIFITLILDGEFYSIIFRLLVLAFGLFYIPSMISVFSNAEKIKVNTFIEKLLLYVILPLTIISIVIVYIYIAKILILRQIPENVIGRILITIYCVAIPVWAMTSTIKNEKFNKIIEKIPYIYLPLIILEIYSIVIRIYQYGFTPSRYLVVLFIIFQLISFFVIIIKKQKGLRELILVILLISLLFLISPLNYRTVSNLSQKNILDKYIENGIKFDNCSKEDQERYKGAYEYLKNEYDSEKYINNKLTDEDVQKFEENSYYKDDNEYVYEHKNLKEMNIQGFSKIYYFNDDHKYNEEIDVRSIRIIFGEKEERQMYIDLSNFLKKVIKHNEEYYYENEYFEENNVIIVDETKKIFITDLSFSYNSKNEIKSLNLEGYILEK